MFSLLIGECYIEVIGQRPKQVMGLRVSFPHSKRLCRVYTSSTLVKSKDQRNGDLAELKPSVALARPKLEKSPGETSALPVRNPAV